MITYAIERWSDYRKDCMPLWVHHYDEIAGDKRMAMQPDEGLFKYLDSVGQLQIMVAREAGEMIGYMLFVVRPHTHYAGVLCGFEDAYYVLPSRRKGWAGIRLIKKSVAALKARGVKRVFVHTKKAKDMGRVLKFLGMTHSDEIYSAWIGD